jgi:hypothetical protein
MLQSLLDSNLIRVFSFYLMLMLLIGLVRRGAFYRDTLLLLLEVRGRWPKLLDRMAQHRDTVLNWPTLRPAVVAIVLMILQMIASRVLWPQAQLTLPDLYHPWWHLPIFCLFVLPMLAVDLYFVICVGQFDREQTADYFDYAERWAGGWRATAVRVVTLGRINPNRIVDEQVREGLQKLSGTMTSAMWWVTLQAGLRLAFGLVLWSLWASQ